MVNILYHYVTSEFYSDFFVHRNPCLVLRKVQLKIFEKYLSVGLIYVKRSYILKKNRILTWMILIHDEINKQIKK